MTPENTQQAITLNLNPYLGEEDWLVVKRVYEGMPGWHGYDPQGRPCWCGLADESPHISASVEPSGLLVTGIIDMPLWVGWLSRPCSELSLGLGKPVYDAELCP